MKISPVFNNAMVVDDDDMIRKMMLRQLNILGINNVWVYGDGYEALSHLKGEKEKPELILCDLKMPTMDGVQFLRHIVDLKFTGAIILVSGEDSRVLSTVITLAKTHQLNVLGALEKPFSIDELEDTISLFKGSENISNTTPVVIDAKMLKTALLDGKIVPYFQPKVDLTSQKIVGVESLARWIHSDLSIISPELFIPVAEDHGLINMLTIEILKTAIKQAGLWYKKGYDLKVAINFSVKNLHDLSLPDFLLQQVNEARINPDRIIIEVTESRLMDDIHSTLEVLTRFRLHGFGLSIDDFGTGYSSMEQLKMIPFDELKIDRSFVKGATNDKTALAILESSISLGKMLGMNIIAEGVETYDDWELVVSRGCDQAQGYYIAKPMSAEDFDKWLTDWELPGLG